MTLLGFATQYQPDWQDLSEDCSLLNEYIIAGRYPGELVCEEIGREQAGEALAAARRIRARVRQVVGGAGDVRRKT